MMNLKTLLVFNLGAIALLSCASPKHTILPIQLTERAVSLPSAYYEKVVFVDNQIIGFSFNSNMPRSKSIFFAYEGDPVPTPFNPENDPKCTTYIEFRVINVLPDGRLGLLKTCRDDLGSTGFFSTHRYIYAYDWKTGNLERLVAGDLTPGTNPKYFTWNPDMSLGIQATNSGWQGTIYWIRPSGMEPMDIQFEARGLTINLKDHLEGNEHTGLVVAPAWSPDGKMIAFFASTYGLKEDATPKYDVRYDMFLMNPTTLSPYPELLDVKDADTLVWSPNNENLLFRGCIGISLTCGLWIYNLQHKTLSLVKEGYFQDYAWVTDEKIIAAKNIDRPFVDNQVWEYTISMDLPNGE